MVLGYYIVLALFVHYLSGKCILFINLFEFNQVWRAAHIFLKDTTATHRFSNSFIEVFFFKPKFKLLCMKNYVKNRMHEQCPVVFIPLFQSLFFIASFSNSIPAVQRATLSPRVDFSGESASCRTLSTTAGVFSCL